MREYSEPQARFGPASSGRLLSPAGRARRGHAARTLHIGYPAEAGSLPQAHRKPYRRQMRPSRGAELLTAVAVAVLFAVCGAVYFCADLLSVADGTFYGNIYVEGVDVGGKTRDQALGLFLAEKKRPAIGVELTVDGRFFNITAEDVGAEYNIEDTLDAALAVGRSGDVLQRLGEVLSLRKARRVFTFTATYDDGKLLKIAEHIAREISLPATNAAVQFLPDSPDVFAYAEESAGKAMDAAVLYEQLKAALDKGVISSLTLKSSPVAPDTTVSALRDCTQLLGTYTTALKPDTVRNKNIGLAGNAVNGAVLFSGDTFSFNGRTGERTKEKGYEDAPAISNSQIVDAPGGGVCLVSSTIYNAALLSGLEIVERHHHTWPVSYVPAGFDATVDWGSSKDLRVKNNMDVPVYLVFRVDAAKGLATAEFYGLPGMDGISVIGEDYMTVMPEKPLKYSNPNKPIGWSRVITAARNGCRISVYRVYTRGGETRRELVSNDVYPTQRGEIEIGTMAEEEDDK